MWMWISDLDSKDVDNDDDEAGDGAWVASYAIVFVAIDGKCSSEGSGAVCQALQTTSFLGKKKKTI